MHFWNSCKVKHAIASMNRYLQYGVEIECLLTIEKVYTRYGVYTLCVQCILAISLNV